MRAHGAGLERVAVPASPAALGADGGIAEAETACAVVDAYAEGSGLFGGGGGDDGFFDLGEGDAEAGGEGL